MTPFEKAFLVFGVSFENFLPRFGSLFGILKVTRPKRCRVCLSLTPMESRRNPKNVAGRVPNQERHRVDRDQKDVVDHETKIRINTLTEIGQIIKRSESTTGPGSNEVFDICQSSGINIQSFGFVVERQIRGLRSLNLKPSTLAQCGLEAAQRVRHHLDDNVRGRQLNTFSEARTRDSC
ncbi:hypothetical protein EVAR_96147_1 [Eumeta japonica]|uniref:Uncharacterized protein n=1 Tax=Eumeta variegata TaxID=151549 RepID=A0A4C1VLB5_EUMVA|nr:hypothetical protein EVAR_96147_1 [Eumeta japonica]